MWTTLYQQPMISIAHKISICQIYKLAVPSLTWRSQNQKRDPENAESTQSILSFLCAFSTFSGLHSSLEENFVLRQKFTGELDLVSQLTCRGAEPPVDKRSVATG